ncbi:MBL fold metallo-hydrolase [Paenibacillus sp. S-38]|uniref:MBL fold metallo-hydrolase n=1 Tax=Paenibacillus sp. S-38 TaxID=3416710 RepID=UPI003CE9A563
MEVRAMSAGEVAAKVVGREALFILDVRNSSDFADWKIEGKRFRHLNVPYFDLLDGVDEMKDLLPAGEEVLVVCAKEGSSVMVAGMLSEVGFRTAYLQGGMKAWSEHLEPVKVGELSGGGELYQFVRVGKGCLSYMAVSDGEAAVIDAARMTDVYTDFAKSLGARMTHVFDTHLHADHISGGRRIAEETGAAYWLPPKDAEEVTFEYEELEDGQTITIGSATIRIHALYTPGHTIGSTSFIVDGRFLLTGDTLFIDSIGRPDLAGKAEDWAGDLKESLHTTYKQLPGDLTVLPAHFMTVDELNEDGSVSAQLGSLFERNHGLRLGEEPAFRRLVTESLPPQPNAYREIRETNRGKLQPDEEKQREMEIGPNRCAVR